MNQLPKPSADLAALGSAALLAAAGDYLFWRATPGSSLGIFVTLCALALVLNTRHRWNESTFIICALLIASAVQTGIEGSFSNLVALLGLICVLTGETTVEGVRGHWARWSEAIWNFLKPISGWLWFASIARQVPAEPRLIHRVGDVSLRVLFPALGLGLVFTLLLGSGNAVFGHWSAEGFNSIVSILTHLDFSIGRAFLWLFLGTFALTLLRPKIAPTVARIWTRRIPELPLPANPVIAKWRSLAVLALLNFLFFVANTADALYLWTSARLPEGVSYSEFVHNGVWSLSAAVVLSAIVLTAIFQQNAAIRAAKSLRVLSLIWIAQNLILISGVFLRLVRYVEAYQLSELRVYVGCFLLLVTIGFGSLTLHILVPQSLNRLLFINALATFALFFVLQFPDVRRWVAEYNVASWEKDPTRTLDVAYLGSLGPSAYRSLIRVAETPNRFEAHTAFIFLQGRQAYERTRLANLNWRSWQERKVRNAQMLVTHDVLTRR